MSNDNLNIIIDFGSSKVRMGVFEKENSKNLFSIEKKSISNLTLDDFNIDSSKNLIKDLIKIAEKKINKHINNIDLLIDTPDMFSIDLSLRKKTDNKTSIKKEIHTLLIDAKNIVQNNYNNKKIIHIIVKKFICDDKEFFELPKEDIEFNSIIVEIKFICFSNVIFEILKKNFNDIYLSINNIFCSSYVRSSSCNLIFDNFKKKVVLDIGYKKSAITIFELNKLQYFNILPIGGKHITTDISKILKITEDAAENIKQSFNQSNTTFLDINDSDNKDIKETDLTNQIIFARIQEIIELNLSNRYFKNFFDKKNSCILVFIGEGSKILNKNSIYLEEKFDLFDEINFFEENSKIICETGLNYLETIKPLEVNFLQKKPKNKGFFEKIFHFFS
tara:strand:- start:199 stop:1368 length:1170 start_codon:yes stop_codon:yes gene_type:complete